MTNEESAWLEEGGALTRQELQEAGQVAFKRITCMYCGRHLAEHEFTGTDCEKSPDGSHHQHGMPVAVHQEDGFTHLDAATLARIHAYDEALDAGVQTQAPGVAA